MRSLNPYLNNGFVHYYHFSDSTLILGLPSVIINIDFVSRRNVSKTYCGVWSGSQLIAYVPQKASGLHAKT